MGNCEIFGIKMLMFQSCGKVFWSFQVYPDTSGSILIFIGYSLVVFTSTGIFRHNLFKNFLPGSESLPEYSL